MKPCTRCDAPHPAVVTMSWFNLDVICMDCSNQEAGHPDFAHAKAVENEQVRKGNLNYEGVGWPGLNGRVQ